MYYVGSLLLGYIEMIEWVATHSPWVPWKGCFLYITWYADQSSLLGEDKLQSISITTSQCVRVQSVPKGFTRFSKDCNPEL